MINPEIKKSLLELMDEALKNRCTKKVICNCFGISLRTLQNWKKKGVTDKRKGSAKKAPSKLSPAENKEIIDVACSDRFKDLTPYEIVPILAEEGTYIASVSSFYRVLRLSELLCYRLAQKAGRRSELVELKASGPNQIWSWDITWLNTDIKGKYFYLYLFTDIWSRAIVGWEIYEEENGQLAKEAFANISKKLNVNGVTLHSDNGSPMISARFQETLHALGVIPSFSRPRVSNDNAYSESLFKTLKYNAGYPKKFTSVESAREWIAKFVNWYNNEHRHSRIGYVTPTQRLLGKDKEIFAKRNETFEEAKKKNPARWSGRQKVWGDNHVVFLKKGNYPKEKAS